MRFKALPVVMLSICLGFLAAIDASATDTVLAEAQRLLKDRACDVGAVDGVWGPRSQGALESLAAAAGIPGKIEPNEEILSSLRASTVDCPRQNRTANRLICSNYMSRRNCDGTKYFTIEYTSYEGDVPVHEHRGIDFRAKVGTPVYSATWGALIWSGYGVCGGAVVVKTNIFAPDPVTHQDAQVYAYYVHMNPTVSAPSIVEPGEQIGTIQDYRELKAKGCNNMLSHVHYAMRTTEYPSMHIIDPNQFWVDGPGKATCFEEGMDVPDDKAVSPLKC